MQCSQPFFVAGPPNCLQFYPCSIPPPQIQNCPQIYQTCIGQTYDGPVQNVVGEGDVTYVVLPDGTVQMFFLPATVPRCGRHLQNPLSNPGWNNANTGGAWFVRSVHPNLDRFQQQRLLQQPCGGSNDYSQNNVLPSCPELQMNQKVKFHNDQCTSSEDIRYFCRAKQQKHEIYCPPVCSTAVQVSQGAKRCCSCAVCDAPCKRPSNCVGVPSDGSFERYDIDMSDDEKRRGAKRRKSPCSLSSSSCDRNRKRRKYEICSDSDCSDISLDQWREKRKRRRKAYEHQRKEQEKERKVREKLKRAREKERKKRVKECEKYVKESEKLEKDSEKEEQRRRKKAMKEIEKCEKDSEKEEKRRRKKAIKEKEKCMKDLEKEDKQLSKCMKYQNSQMDTRPYCGKPLCDNHMNKLRINKTVNMCTDTNDECCTSSSKCILCKLATAVSNLVESVTSSSTCATASTCHSDNECPKPKPCDVECPKLYYKDYQKLVDKELKRREAVRIKSEKDIVKKLIVEQKKSEQELIKRESESKKIDAKIQKKIKNAQKRREKEQQKKEQQQKKREKEMRKSNLKESSSKDCSCSASTMSIKKTYTCCNSPLKIVDISDDPCPNCDNYCSKAQKPPVHQADAYYVDDVLKSAKYKCNQSCSSNLDTPADSRKDCGVFCERPTTENKQIATHTEQANSGIFFDILKKFGIGVQCSKCSPPPTPAPACDGVGSQLSFEFVARGSDGNLAICTKTDPSCHPL